MKESSPGPAETLPARPVPREATGRGALARAALAVTALLILVLIRTVMISGARLTYASSPPSLSPHQAAASNPSSPSSLACGPDWQVVPSPNIALPVGMLQAVEAVSANDVWAVGSDNVKGTLIEHWNGTEWSIVPSPEPNPGTNDNPSLRGVAVVSANDIWAVGASTNYSAQVQETLVEHWNGTEWSIIPSPNQGTNYNYLNGVAAVSANDVWAVGYSQNSSTSPVRTLIEHWNGTEWSIIPSPNQATDHNWLNDIAGASANDLWAVGKAGPDYVHDQTLILHWNGTEWSILPSGNLEGPLNGVVAPSASDVRAV